MLTKPMVSIDNLSDEQPAIIDVELAADQEKSVGMRIERTKAVGLKADSMVSQSSGNYNTLLNKPSINDVVLVGNKTMKQLGIEPATLQDIDNILFGIGV